MTSIGYSSPSANVQSGSGGIAEPARPATQRAASTARLVDMIAALEGFTGGPTAATGFVTRPYSGGPKGRRQVVIGQSRDGTVGRTGIAADHAPTDDRWSVPWVILS